MSTTANGQTTGETPITNAGEKPNAETGTTQPPASFDAWLQQQDENARRLYEEHVSGLKNALKSERTEKGDLSKQLKDLAKKAEEGSALKAELDRLAATQEKTSRRADFLESAVAAGVTDLKLAWKAVSADGDEFLDRKGQINFEALKAAHPGLFEKPRVPDVNAGRGLGGGNPNKSSTAAMNDFIRKAAGYA